MTKGTLIIRSNIKKVVQDLQGNDEQVTSVAEEVGRELDRKVEQMILDAINRAKANKRRTLQARDL